MKQFLRILAQAVQPALADALKPTPVDYRELLRQLLMGLGGRHNAAAPQAPAPPSQPQPPVEPGQEFASLARQFPRRRIIGGPVEIA